MCISTGPRASCTRDPFCDPDGQKWKPFIEAISKERLVVLTRDKVTPQAEGPPMFERTDYVAIFAVDDVQILDKLDPESGPKTLHFRFVKRVEDLS